MTREEIEQLNVTEPYCCETDREEQWYQVGLIDGLRIADQHPRKGLWDSEKVMLFLIGAFKELPNGNGTFKLKKECSMEQLLEDLRKAMED